MANEREISNAVNVLLDAARRAYGDSNASPPSAYRFSVSPDGSKLEILKSGGLDWRDFDISNSPATKPEH